LKIRQYLLIYLFFTICGGLIFLSNLGHFKRFGSEHAPVIVTNKPDQLEESFFKGVNYFSIEKSKPFLELETNELSISNTEGIVLSFNPIGTLYRYDKANKPEEPIIFQSKNSRVLLKKKNVYLDKEVEIKMAGTQLNADSVAILENGEQIDANQNVKTVSSIQKTNDQVLVESNRATYFPKRQIYEYRNNVSGKVNRKRVYEEGVSFITDQLLFNVPESLITLKGKVSFKKDNLDVLANRGEVFLENYNKKLKYYALYDDVRLQESLFQNGKPLMRKAFAEKLEGISSEKKIVLTGFPKVFQLRDVIKGNRITIRENVETVEVDDANSSITIEKD
jgi:lipopolysaccharide export system protein LptA